MSGSTLSWLWAILRLVADQIDDDGASQDQHIVLSLVNLHSVAVADGDPLLRDVSHLPAPAPQAVLVVKIEAPS